MNEKRVKVVDIEFDGARESRSPQIFTPSANITYQKKQAASFQCLFWNGRCHISFNQKKKKEQLFSISSLVSLRLFFSLTFFYIYILSFLLSFSISHFQYLTLNFHSILYITIISIFNTRFPKNSEEYYKDATFP